MLSQITLDKILDKVFLEKFMNCVSLLPTGRLILNLTQSTYEKIPIEFSRKTSKFTGFVKYGNQLFF